jgi:cyclopropane fatty-acyl-phospholipid synthase-like methyltransferase
MDKNKKTVEAYDKNPQFYAEKFDSYGIRIEDVDRALLLNESGSDMILELGCGSGRDAQYIISRVGKENYFGTDASEGLIKLCREKIPEGMFQVKDMREVSYETETFGAIFSFASMLHVNREEMTQIIEKCHKWLKTGGILYISTKYGEYREENIKKFGEDKYYYFYTPEDIEKLCPYKFFVVYKNVQDIRGQSWFEIALRKI